MNGSPWIGRRLLLSDALEVCTPLGAVRLLLASFSGHLRSA